MSATRPTSHAITGTMLAIVLLTAVAFAATGENLQLSNSQGENPKPILVVWAHTDIPNQGEPTLDLLDLERYFVTRLDALRISNVGPSATARLPKRAPSNMYLIDLRVDAMQPADRTLWNSEHSAYYADHIFNVELSLRIKNLQSGQVFGATGERYEYHFANYYEAERLEPKRLAISTAAYNLADRFANLATAGQFGDTLKSIQAPLPSLWERFMNGDKDTVGVVLLAALGTIAGLAVLIAMIVCALNALFPPPPRRLPRTAVAPPPPPPADPARDKYLKEVIALAEKSGDFSEEWLRSEAQRNLDVLLRDADIIYARHAERMLQKKERNKERKDVATYAARRCGLDYADIYAKVQRAEDIQYELLRTAHEIAQQRATKKPPQAPPPASPEKVEAERRSKSRQQELDALEHERQKKQRELEVERVGRQIRDSQTDLRSGSGSVQMDEVSSRRQEARNGAEEVEVIKLDADDAAADAAAKRVSLARNKCIHVFQDIHMRAGEKRARIQGILDSFEFRHDILPRAVQEFMEEGYQEAEG